jgi:hypothetical protein
VSPEIRIYVEGGGDRKSTKSALRRGFHGLLRKWRDWAFEVGVRVQVVACGGRQQTYEAFRNAHRTSPGTFNILLVDAEGPVKTAPRGHLAKRENWRFKARDEEHVHLMAQVMEAWLVADPSSMAGYYGRGFRVRDLPQDVNVERVSPKDIQIALVGATRGTSKGTYHKTKHAPEILSRLNPDEVRRKAHHFDRLVQILEARLRTAQ